MPETYAEYEEYGNILKAKCAASAISEAKAIAAVCLPKGAVYELRGRKDGRMFAWYSVPKIMDKMPLTSLPQEHDTYRLLGRFSV